MESSLSLSPSLSISLRFPHSFSSCSRPHSCAVIDPRQFRQHLSMRNRLFHSPRRRSCSLHSRFAPWPRFKNTFLSLGVVSPTFTLAPVPFPAPTRTQPSTSWVVAFAYLLHLDTRLTVQSKNIVSLVSYSPIASLCHVLDF